MANIIRLLDELSGVLDPHENAVRQVREIVPVEEWLENPFYCGEDGAFLYDFWKEEITSFFNSRLSEWVIYGSLGGGKTTCAAVTLIRRLYELSCFENIPLIFNLMSSTVLYMIYFSISLTQATRTGYGRIQRMVDGIPYFSRYFRRNDKITSELQFPSIRIVYGSQVAHQIGLDLFGSILDEGDFFGVSSAKAAQEYSAARDIYTSIINRRKLRFSVGGVDQGLSILISSPAYGSDFVERRILQVKKRNSAKVTNVTGFRVTPQKYQDDGFWVYSGNDDVDPMLVDSVEDLETLYDLLDLPIPPESRKWDLARRVAYCKDVLELSLVPNDFRDSFEDDLLKAIRDILGRAIRPIAGYLTEDQIRAAVDHSRRHPFSRQALMLSTENSARIEDYIDLDLLGPPDLPRCIHIDQSVTTDRTGMACSYVSANSLLVESDPSVTVDFMLALTPPVKGEIPILRCVEFVVWLRDQGYEIGYVTMDSYQSRASLQYLRDHGIGADILSVDRNDDAYVAVRALALRGMFSIYDSPLFIREVRGLIWNRSRRKIDHPPHGSKDVADAVAASAYQAIIRNGLIPSISGARDIREIKFMERIIKETEWERLA